MERELKRVKGGRLVLIPISEETRGHGATGMEKFWKGQLQEFLVGAGRVGKLGRRASEAKRRLCTAAVQLGPPTC